MATRRNAMAEYYARRAAEYERVYQKPERQADLRRIEALVSTAFPGARVLEVACGTGYWTQFIARSAGHVLATDVSPEVLAVAGQKDYGACQVERVRSDAYSLANVPAGFDAGFHGFWWSHVPVERVAEFLSTFHAKLRPNAKVVMIDNRYVEGSSTPLSRRDDRGNTYQLRTLADGSGHEVLKNFPSPDDLTRALAPLTVAPTIRQLAYYWTAEYRTPGDVCGKRFQEPNTIQLG